MNLFFQDKFLEVQQPVNGRGRKDAGVEFFWCVVPILSYRLPHLGLPHIFPGIPIAGMAVRDTQMGTKGEDWSLPWTLAKHLEVIAIIKISKNSG